MGDAHYTRGAEPVGGQDELVGGFWVVAVAGAMPGDCDADGDVDAADYAEFRDCLCFAADDACTNGGGPGSGLGPGCECFDFDSDLDVDLPDFAEFQAAFTG